MFDAVTRDSAFDDNTAGRRPCIASIRRGSHDDGPGIRTVVFFKGCPLRCVFCQNPETQERRLELSFASERCIGCRACVAVCPNGCIIDGDPQHRIQRAACQRCAACAQACPTSALQSVGREFSITELAEALARDASFFQHSGGGVTLSGGECTMYPEYAGALCRELKGRGIHVAVETCGWFEYDTVARTMLPHIDLVLYDLKVVDDESSRRWLGQSSARILENLKRLLETSQVEVQPRMPVIPGITDRRENLAAAVAFLRAFGAKTLTLLPYNPLGREAWHRIGRAAPDLPEHFASPDEDRRLLDWVRELLAQPSGPCVP